MSVLIKPQTNRIDGILRSVDITPETAGWQYVSFAVYHLLREQMFRGAANGRETTLIVLSGTGRAELNGQPVGQIGERLSVFENKAPYALYLSEDASYQLECTSDAMEIAIASAPTTHRHLPVRVIRPEDIGVELRGEGNVRRRVQHILDTDQEAERLILVEVITPVATGPRFHHTNTIPRTLRMRHTWRRPITTTFSQPMDLPFSASTVTMDLMKRSLSMMGTLCWFLKDITSYLPLPAVNSTISM